MGLVKTTQEKFKVNGIYTKERQVLHENIISYFMDEKQTIMEPPEAYLLGGGTASGKSHVGQFIINGYAKIGVSLIYIDCDEIKRLIPEYETMGLIYIEEAASHVHDESSDISQELLERCIKEKRNFIYDGTMKNFLKYDTLIRNLIDNGYKVTATIVDVPIEVAKEREHLRFLETGRKVKEEFLIESHQKVPQTFYCLKNLVHEYVIYDGTVEGEPIEIAVKEEGEEIIFNLEKLEKFYGKSGIKL
ncbi:MULTISPECIES: zeta toxin family protein [Bacillus cereus group]|uniref:zeta toxin family protein n=1 Tax=Bacillus cereus group TaxID=86661 RepID=UPI000BAC7BE8|nr:MULTISPECIES: zeta toxin family protein [Bacillus cereus group]PAW37974.1 hypothetical protein CKQ70_30145 [Bacillus toyonensis]PAW43791.1 hypothetical protein CKQ69_30345 [Bacillus toyonensis]PGV81856.1 Zeta toxin [Bacillus thuringiensis]